MSASCARLREIDGEMAEGIEKGRLARADIDRGLGMLDHGGPRDSMADRQLEPLPDLDGQPALEQRLEERALRRLRHRGGAGPAELGLARPPRRLDAEGAELDARL